MTIIDQRLMKLAQALQQLAPETQTDVLDEMEARIANLTKSALTNEQRDIVKMRMAQPRVYVSNEEVANLLRRFKSPT